MTRELTRDELETALTDHKHQVAAELNPHMQPENRISFDVCAKCFVQWPCIDSRALTMALALLDLREGIEELRRTWAANSDKYKKLHVADVVADLDRALLTPKSERSAAE
jgi:hypothetical protein